MQTLYYAWFRERKIFHLPIRFSKWFHLLVESKFLVRNKFLSHDPRDIEKCSSVWFDLLFPLRLESISYLAFSCITESNKICKLKNKTKQSKHLKLYKTKIKAIYERLPSSSSSFAFFVPVPNVSFQFLSSLPRQFDFLKII